jgi:hypothetical protein
VSVLVDACRYCGHRQADHSVEGLNPCTVCRCESWQRMPIGSPPVWFSKLDMSHAQRHDADERAR